MTNAYYDALDVRYTQGGIPSEADMGPILRGETAAAVGHEMLMQATGTTTIDDAVRVALGRPRKGAAATTVVKAAMPEGMARRVHEAARRQRVSSAQIVRAAVADYLERV